MPEPPKWDPPFPTMRNRGARIRHHAHALKRGRGDAQAGDQVGGAVKASRSQAAASLSNSL